MSKSVRADIKILVIGCSGTGKTSFVHRWTKDEFSENYKPTIVSEFGFKIFNSNNNNYRIQLWDIGGQDKSPSMAKIFARDSHGCIVISDSTKIDLINDTIKWKTVIEKESNFIDGGELPFVLVQNKVDLLKENEIENVENISKKACKENGFNKYFLISVKENKNVNEAMACLIDCIIERLEKYLKERNEVFNDKKRKETIKLRHNSEIADKKKCC